MVKRRYLAALPSAIFGVGPFFKDVRDQMMDLGLTGEALGFWIGIAISTAVGCGLYAFWPDIRRLFIMIGGFKGEATKKHREAVEIPRGGIINNYGSIGTVIIDSDGKYRTPYDGKGEIVSPNPPKVIPLKVEFPEAIGVSDASSITLRPLAKIT